MHALVGDIKSGVVEAVGQNFGSYFNFELDEREVCFGVVNCKIESDPVQKVNFVELLPKKTKIGSGYCNLRIDAFFGYVGSSNDVKFGPMEIKVISKRLRI